MQQQDFIDDIQKLLDVLPGNIVDHLKNQELTNCIEVVLDLGRTPEVRFSDGKVEYLGSDLVTTDDINYIVGKIDDFTSDNRSGIQGTLHRVSGIRNRKGHIIGLTCRIGRAITGTIDCIKDLVETGKSILLLGKPGVGKTTKLREVTYMIANSMGKRVIVVDTSNEIAGDGDIPHRAIGNARRMQVTKPEWQKNVMIEAVENHTPEVVIVDEIGTEEETLAARTIAERGVSLIATAHGNTLDNLIKNPLLWDLIGGVKSVTIGDDEARRRGTQKTVLEREKEPTFDIVVEIRDRNTLAIYPSTAEAVDCIIRGVPVYPEIRRSDLSPEKVKILQTSYKPIQMASLAPKHDIVQEPEKEEPLQKVYIYALSRTIVDKVIERNEIPVEITRTIDSADLILALKTYSKTGSKIYNIAKNYDIPIYFARSNTLPQIQHTLLDVLNISYLETDKFDRQFYDETEEAIEETKRAIASVLKNSRSITLKPRKNTIRKIQHELIENHDLYGISIGEDSERHIQVSRRDSKIQDVG